MDAELAVSRVAAAIGEPARARMLFALMDDRARTATELAAIADVAASTASVHLNRLSAARLVTVVVQGKHRYFRLDGADVAATLEGLRSLAGARDAFVPNTPSRLRVARTCYDHLAGTLGVALHDRMLALGWLSPAYAVKPLGAREFAALKLDLDAVRTQRRRFAFGCLDWSERRYHLGGALGAAILDVARSRRWLAQDRDSRAITVTALGRRELRARFGISG